MDADETPLLALDGFHGPLARLLDLARAHRVALERISLAELAEQLTGFLQGPAPLVRKADGLVMAAWLLQLRAGLLTPQEGRAPPPQPAAGRRLLTPRHAEALAAWLGRRPALGHDVFARGDPTPGEPASPEPEPDVIEFLWASLALFDADLPPADTAPRYRPPALDLHTIEAAALHLRRLLAMASEPQPLGRLVPPPAADDRPVRRRSAWSSAFAASLELARRGEAMLAQEDAFGIIHVAPASVCR